MTAKLNTNPVAKSQPGTPLQRITQWFKRYGWQPWPYQKKAWQAYKQGQSGLIHVPTGAGKTYAALMGPLMQLLAQAPSKRQQGLKVLVITPLRSLSRDTEKAIQQPIQDMALPITVETRTGDTKLSVRRRQRVALPDILITTPESFSLLLSYANAQELFSQLKCVLVDEWHELVGSKRGLQLELNLSRVKQFNAGFQIWGMSATLADPQAAANVIIGINNITQKKAGECQPQATVIDAKIKRPINIQTLLPPNMETFPWAGHMGLRMLPSLVAALDINQSTLIFTNTRAQAERWYQEILASRPEWAGLIALHHGSLDEKNRRFVEDSLKSGLIKLVVCTSSLDLGVDFPLVEQVVQIGSPKGVARLMQRAGRAKHRVGETCNITCVPTNALQILEFTAVRHAVEQKKVEAKPTYSNAYDVLAQHIVTCAAGGGFTASDLYAAVTSAYSYQSLTRQQFDWVLELVEHGGSNLKAYPEYHKIENSQGNYTVKTPRLERLHRMNIGTISSDSQMAVRFAKGKKLGYVEEGFVAKLKRGDRFVFAGRTLELFRVEDDAALVKLSKAKPNVVAKWSGSRMPISESLGAAMRETLNFDSKNTQAKAEFKALAPVFHAQKALSSVPTNNQLLVETCKTREGYHCFLFPFEGRIVHEGLAPLLALRMAKNARTSLSLSVDDYGIELLSKHPFDFEAQFSDELASQALFSQSNLLPDILESINLSNLAKRQFRDIARIAGLTQQNFPGKRHSARQLQTSASLLYDVFQRYDPNNLLVSQAHQETLEQFFELARLARCLTRLGSQQLIINHTERPTPFAFPLIAERVTSTLSNESAAEILKKLATQWDIPA